MRNRRWLNTNTTAVVLFVAVGGATAATLSSCSSSGSPSAGADGTDNLGAGGAASNGAGGFSAIDSGGSTAVAGCTSVSVEASSGAWPVVNVDLIPEKDGAAPYTQVIGHPWDGPPLPELLDKMLEVGDCQLLKVRHVLCDPPACNSTTAKCVGNDGWARDPVKVSIGDLSFSGLTLQSGGTSFTLLPSNNVYQAAGVTGVAYPPCVVGADVTVAGAADSATAFSLGAKCIEPLVVTNTQPLPFEQDKATVFTWTAPRGGNSRVTIEIDISHHGGGLKGLIRCETADTGSHTVDALLVAGLIGYGTAGFPEATLTRHNTSTTAVGTGTATLNIQTTSAVTLVVPGVVSCNDENACPSGQSCLGSKCQ